MSQSSARVQCALTHAHAHAHSSHGVLARPLARRLAIPLLVRFVESRDLGHQRVVSVWLVEHGTDGQQDLCHGQRRAPLFLQNVQADAAVTVDVWVVDTRREVALGRLERVVCGELDVEEEDPALVGRVRGTHDGRLPVVDVVPDRPCRTPCNDKGNHKLGHKTTAKVFVFSIRSNEVVPSQADTRHSVGRPDKFDVVPVNLLESGTFRNTTRINDQCNMKQLPQFETPEDMVPRTVRRFVFRTLNKT